MKKNFVYLVALAAFVFVISTGCSRHATASKNPKDTVFIPFTKQLKQRIESSHLDITKVQFFVDQKLVLRRSMGAQKSEIKSGVILFENGQYVNEVVIPRYTPGICENVFDGKLMISFEEKNNSVSFGPGGLNDNYFTLYARNWNAGVADMTYDNKIYKVQCVTCYNVGDVKLVVRKSEIDRMENNKRTVEGRKVTD